MDMPIEMQHQAMGYDRTATMFSPEGHLLQVEYAEKTVRLGSSSIAMVCSDGVFIIADKRNDDPLIVTKSSYKIYEVDSHIILSAAGITSDARILVERAQLMAQEHRITYDTPIEPELVIKDIANIKQQFTQYGGARPFGVAVMIAGINRKEPEIYAADITGNYFSYNANAIGEDDDKIKEQLRKKYKKSLTIKKGVELALDIFKETQKNKFDLKRFELAYLNKNEGRIERVDGMDIKKFAS